jgi:hypothetical protein
LKSWNWPDLRRGALLLGTPAVVLWLGATALDHIKELYDGLCPVQGRGMADYLYRDNPLGYCAGISTGLDILGFIMVISAVALMGAIVMWWKVAETPSRNEKKSNPVV